MDLIFNELSIYPLAENKTSGFERVKHFLKTFKRSKDFNYNKIRFDVLKGEDVLSKVLVTNEYTLADYRRFFLQDKENRRYGDLLMGLPKRPFIDENSEEENLYIQTSFRLNKNGEIIDPYGLSAAYLYSTLGIGFCSESFWGSYKYELIIIKETECKEDVFCVSKPEHFSNNDLIDFIENKIPIQLIESNIKPQNKTISLRDDHGKDKLFHFAKKIAQSPFVESVINSIPYNPCNKNFIKDIFPNGNIEIVLTDTDRGLGMVVKTTGRNLRETKAIADILKTKYER